MGKICKVCNTDNELDSKFCNSCGAMLEDSQPTAETNDISAPATAITGTDDTAAEPQQKSEDANIAEPQPSSEIIMIPEPQPAEQQKEPKKSGSTGKLVAIIAAAVVVVIAIFVVAFFPYVKNFCRKTFMSSDSYLQAVLKEQSEENVSDYAKSYDHSLTYYSDNFGSTGAFSIQLSEDAIDDLEGMLEYEIGNTKLDFLSGVTLNGACDRKGDQVALQIGLAQDKDQILNLEIIMDAEEDCLYFRCADINEEYACIELDDVMDDDEVEEFEDAVKMFPQLKNAMPTAAQAEKLINRYVAIAISQIDDVEKDTDTLEIGDLEQKVTTLEFRLTEDMLANMITEICKEMADDEDLENYVKQICDASAEFAEDEDIDSDDIWDDFQDALEEAEEEADDIDMGSTKADFCIYVNAKGEMIGMEYSLKESSGTTKLLCAEVVKGSKYAATYRIDESYDDYYCELLLEGSKHGDAITADGTLTAKSYDSKYEYDFQVEDWDFSHWMAGNMSGTITFKGEDYEELIDDILYYEVDLDSYEASELAETLADYSVAFTFNVKDYNGDYSIALMDDDETYLGISYSLTNSDKGSVSIPKDSTRVKDEDSMMDYLGDCDFDDLLDKLDDIGIPSYILDALEDYTDML